MSKEKDIDSRVVGSTVKIEIAVKVMKKYLHDGEKSQSLAIARALEDAVRDVQLDADDLQKIADEARVNMFKRMEARAARKRSR